MKNPKFKANKNIQIHGEFNYGNGRYSPYGSKSNIRSIDNGINTINEIGTPIDISGSKLLSNFKGTSYSDLKNIKKGIESVFDVRDGMSAKKMVSFDLETFGELLNNNFNGLEADNDAKALFSIMEASSVSFGFKNKKEVFGSSKNLMFGINEKQERLLNDIVTKFEKGTELTGSERFTLSTLSKYNKGLTINGDSFEYNPGELFNKNNTIDMRSGIEKLRRIGSMGYTIDSDYGRKQLIDYMEEIRTADIIVGQNSKVFDENVIAKVYKQITGNDYVSQKNQIHVDTYEAIDKVKADISKAYGKDSGVGGGYRKLENLMKLFNVEEDGGAHTALYDSKGVVKLFTEKISNLDNKSVMEHALDLVKNDLKRTKNMNNQGRFIARSSSALKTIHGANVSKGNDFIFDHITVENNYATSSKDGIHTMTYEFLDRERRSLFKKGNVYDLNEVKKITRDDVANMIALADGNPNASDMFKAYTEIYTQMEKEKLSEIYMAKFKNKTSNLNENSYMFRSTQDEIIREIESSLSLSDFNRDHVLAQKNSINMESFTRTYSDYFRNRDGSVKLVDDLKQFEAIRFDFSLSDVEFNKKNLKKLLTDGYVTDKNGNIKNIAEVFKTGGLGDGINTVNDAMTGAQKVVGATQKNATKYLNGFNFYEDMEKLAGAVIGEQGIITRTKNVELYGQALTDAIELVKKDVEKKGGTFTSPIAKKNTDSAGNMLKINFNDGVSHVDISSYENLRSSFDRLSKKTIHSTKISSNNSAEQMRNLKDIAKDLKQRRIISKADYDNISRMSDPFSIVGSLTNAVEVKTIAYRNLSINEKINPLNAFEEVTQKIQNINKNIKDERKGIRKKNKERSKLLKNEEKDVQAITAIEHMISEKKQRVITAKNKIKGLKRKQGTLLFANKNIGVEDLELYNVNKKFEININGKIETIKDYIKDGIGGIEGLTGIRGNLKRKAPTGIVKEITTSNTVDNFQEVINFAGGQLGMNRVEAKSFANSIFGEFGFLKKQKDKSGQELGVSFITQIDDKNMKTAKMILAPKKRLDTVRDAILDGIIEKDPYSAVINLPTMERISTDAFNSIDGAFAINDMENMPRIMRKGGKPFIVEEYLSMWMKNSDADVTKMTGAELRNMVNYAQKSSADDVFSVFRYMFGREDVGTLLKNGQGSIVSKKFNSAINAKMENLKPMQGGGWFFNGTEAVYKSIANKADTSSFNATNIEGIIDMLPLLWRELSDEEYQSDILGKKGMDRALNFKKQIYNLFEKNNKSKSDVDAFMNRWLQDIVSNNSTYKLDGLSNADGIAKRFGRKHMENVSYLAEWLTVNANAGASYLGVLQDSQLILGAEGNKATTYKLNNATSYEGYEMKSGDLKNYINNLVARFSQAVSEPHVSKGRGSTLPVWAQVFAGSIQDQSRPVSHQQGGAKFISLLEKDEELLRAATDNGIILSGVIEPRPVSGGLPFDDKYKPLKLEGTGFLQDDELKLIDSLTINTRMIQDAGITERAELIRKKVATDEKLRDTLYEILNKDKVDVVPKQELDFIIDSMITDFSSRVTNEQKSQLSPQLSYILKNKEYKELGIDSIDLVVDNGSVLNSGTLLGYDSNGKEVFYKDKRAAVIEGRHGNKLALRRLDSPASELKYISGSEKSVLQLSTYDNDINKINAAQLLWDEMFSTDTQKVHGLSLHELNKHSSANFGYSQIVDAAAYASLDGSDDAISYMEEKLLKLNALENYDREIGGTGYRKRYKNSEYEAGAFFIPSDSIVNPTGVFGDQNVDIDIQSKFEQVREEILGDAKNAYIKKIENKELIGNEKFLSKFYEQTIENGDDDIYRHIFSLTALEKEYSVGSDAFEFIDNSVASKSSKIGMKELFWFGRKTGYSQEAREKYYDLDSDGNIKGMAGDSIREYFISKMKEDSNFIETKKDLQAKIKTTSLMSSDSIDYVNASVSQIEEMEKMLGVADDVFSINLQDAIMHGADTTPEKLSDTIFGIAGDKRIIRVDLSDSNLTIDNTLTKKAIKIGNFEYATSGESSYFYFANTSNEFINKDGIDIFIPSEYQKEVSSAINNLKIASTGDAGALEANKRASEHISNMYKMSIDDLNTKDGLILGKMYNTRMPFSGQSLYGSILEENFNVDGTHIKSAYNKNLTLDLSNVRGGLEHAPIDIEYKSLKNIMENTSQTILEDTGLDLISGNFDNNKRLKKSLIDKGLFKGYSNYNIDEIKQIGRLFLEEEGLQTISTRYPTFGPETQVATMTRLKPQATEFAEFSDSSIIHEHTALKLNADTDGDTGSTIFLGRRGEDGRFHMFDSSEKIRISHQRMIEGQAIDNIDHWIPMARERRIKMEAMKEQGFSAREFVELSDKLTKETGFAIGSDAALRAFKAKYDKIAIGPISNANYYTNELAYFNFANTANGTDFDKIDDILEFTKFTEQKIISAKLADAGSNNHIDKARRYQNAMGAFTTKSVKQGVNDMLQILSDSDYLDYDDINDFFKGKSIDVFMSKNRNKRIANIDRYISSSGAGEDARMLLMGVGTMADMYSSENVQNLSKDIAFRHNAIGGGNNKTDYKEAARIIKNTMDENASENNFNIESFANALKYEAISSSTDSIEIANKLNNTRQSLRRLQEDVYVGEGGDSVKISDAIYSGVDGDKKVFSYNAGNDTHFIKTSNNDLKNFESFVNKDMESRHMFRFDSSINNLNVADKVSANFSMQILNDIANDGILTTNEFIDTRNKMHEQIINMAKNKPNSEDPLSNSLNDIINKSYKSAIARGIENGEEFTSEIANKVFDISSYTPSAIEVPYTYSQKSAQINTDNVNRLRKKLTNNHIDSSTLMEEVDTRIASRLADRDMVDMFDDSVLSVINSDTFELNKNNIINSSKKRMYAEVSKNIAKNNSDFTGKVFNEYKQSANDVVEALRYNKSTSIGQSANEIVSNIDYLGDAKVIVGQNAGLTLSEMNSGQISQSASEIYHEIISRNLTSDSKEYELLSKSYESISKYSDSVNVAKNALLNPDMSSDDVKMINNTLKDVNKKGVLKQISAGDFIDDSGIDIGDYIRSEHDRIIKLARAEKRAFSETVEGAMSAKGSGKKALLLGAGALVAGSLIAGSFGVAKSLDPDSKNNLVPENESGVVIRKKSPGKRPMMGNGNPMMENRTRNIRAVSTGGDNTKQLLDVLKVNYGDGAIKVNISNDRVDNNTSSLLEREVAEYI